MWYTCYGTRPNVLDPWEATAEALARERRRRMCPELKEPSILRYVLRCLFPGLLYRWETRNARKLLRDMRDNDMRI